MVLNLNTQKNIKKRWKINDSIFTWFKLEHPEKSS